MLLLVLKSSACLAVFMLFYKLFLEKESIHQFKRFYLLAALLASIVIPFITFTQYIEVEPIQDFIPFQPLEFSNTELFTPEVTTWQDYIPTVLWSIYILGVLLFSFRFVLNLRAIFYRIKTNPKHQYHEFTNVLMQDLIHPHTFFKYIFLNKTKYEHNLIPNEVMLHEQTHAKQKHALDILCIEVLQIIFWFNPLLYFIKKDIKLNHEFLADQAVLQKGVDSAQYKQTLLAFSSNATEPQLVNAINYSLIKKRFTVMKSKTSKQAFWLRSLVLLPILAILIYSFSKKEIIEKEVALVDPIAIHQATDDKGATETMMKEYREFIKEFEKSNTIWVPKLNRAIAIYDMMTTTQRASVKMYPKTFFPSSLSKVKPKTPSEIDFNSWKNKKEFAIWIDGKNVSNEILNNYSASDITYYTVSKVYKNAQTKKHPQPYQNNLYTKKGFEETYLKSGVKKYNHLRSKYLNSIKENALSDDELRILKTQVEKTYEILTNEEIEKYAVEKLASLKVNTSDNVIVTRDQVIEYNKLKHPSSVEFHYTNQTYWVKNKKGEKIAKKYYELSEKDKRKWLVFPPPIYTKKQISIEQFEKLFDDSKYVVRINGRVVDKKELKKHKSTDFVSFSSSKISELAELPQKYHYNLFTENGHKMNLYTKKFSDNYKPKSIDLKNQENIANAIQAGNYPIEFYFRKIDDNITVSNPQKQMVESVKKDKLKFYLQDLIKEVAIKPEEIITTINIEEWVDKKRVTYVEDILRSVKILKINKKDYTPPKLDPNFPPPPPPPPVMKNLVDNMNNQSKELQIAWEAYKTEGDKYGSAAQSYFLKKEGTIKTLKEQYKEVMKLYNTYNNIAKNEKVNVPPPPLPPFKKSNKKGPQVDDIPTFEFLKNTTPLDQIIELSKKGLDFYYEETRISSDKAIELVKSKKVKGIHYININGKERVKLSKESKNKKVNQQKATLEEITEYNKISKHYNSKPIEKRIYKQKDVKRLKYLYNLMSDKQKKDAEAFPNIPPPPPPPAMDTISTYKSLAKRTKFIPSNRKNNIQYLKVLFNKMSNSQKEKVESPNSISKYVAQLDNLTPEQIKKVNGAYNKIKARTESKGRKFYSAEEYKKLEELYSNIITITQNVQKFNSITVPKGGEFKLVLSDGTKVFLKSESQLKYPKKFMKGETRKIELVYGEAFFDVASNKDYDSNFIVITDGKEINVSGTQLIKK